MTLRTTLRPLAGAVWVRTRGLAMIRALALLLALSHVLRAHDPGISTAQVEILGDRIRITTGFAPADAESFLPAEIRPGGSWTDEQFQTVESSLQPWVPRLWQVESGRERLRLQAGSVRLLPGDNVSFQAEYAVERLEGELRLSAEQLGLLPGGHRQFLIVSDAAGALVGRKLLRAEDPGVVVPIVRAESVAVPAATRAAVFGQFLWLGVEHIWLGFDHLLFLFGLLLVCTSLRSMVVIISCFTVAHSITLVLAALDRVEIPASWVEPAIAASILFVGVENLWRRGAEPRGRWLLTFVFGLIHGFGFAGVLRDLGLGQGPAGEVVLPLLSFNLGVELGQLVLAGLFLPLLWRARRNPRFQRRGVPLLSGLIALAGLYWFVERVFFR